MERPKRTVKKTEAAENIAKLLSKGGGRKRSEAGEDKEAAAAAASGSEQSAKGKKQVSSRVFPIPGIFRGPATYYPEPKPRNRKGDPWGYTINGPVGPEAPISTQFLLKKTKFSGTRSKVMCHVFIGFPKSNI